jgi:hypothetical protein
VLRTVVCAGDFGSSFLLFNDNRLQQLGTLVSVVHPMARQQQQPGRTPPLIIMDDCMGTFWNRHRLGSATLEQVTLNPSLETFGELFASARNARPFGTYLYSLFPPGYNSIFPSFQIALVGISYPTFSSWSDLRYIPILHTFLLYKWFFYSEYWKPRPRFDLQAKTSGFIPGNFPLKFRGFPPGKISRYSPGFFPGFYK